MIRRRSSLAEYVLLFGCAAVAAAVIASKVYYAVVPVFAGAAGALGGVAR